PSATVKPTVGALNDPTLGQHVEPLCCVGALDDLERNSGLLFYIVGRRLALVTAIRDGLLERGEPLGRNGQERRDHVAILHVARRDREIDQETERIDGRVSFLAFDFLARVISGRINLCPPFPRFSRFGYRRLRGSVLGPCPPVRAPWHRVHDGSL